MKFDVEYFRQVFNRSIKNLSYEFSACIKHLFCQSLFSCFESVSYTYKKKQFCDSK